MVSKTASKDGDSHVPDSSNVFIYHAEAVWRHRDNYGPPGFKGVFMSPYVALCAAFAAIGGKIFGYDQGVVSIGLVMPQFLARFPQVSESSSSAGFDKDLLTAMIELGALIGALNQGWVADKISRKYCVIVAVAVFSVGSALQTGPTGYAMLVVARLIGGIGIGMLSMVAPLYISEISPPEIRGALLVLEELSIVTGIVIAYWITYGTRYMAGEWAWRLPFLLQLIPGFVLGAGMLFLPFSPRWLVSKGRDGEALEALRRLRRLPSTDPRVQLEWYDIRAEVAFHKESSALRHADLQDGSTISRIRLELASWTDCFERGCWRRTHIGIAIMFFQQFVGISLGRRPLLLWGSFFMTISHFIIAILVGKFSNDWPHHRAAGWVSVAFLLFYMLSFGSSWGPVPWAMPSKIFPSSLRAKGVALSTCSNWLNNFIIGLITPPLVQNTGFGAYTFFAVFCLLSLLWTFYFVPETRGRTLEAMDHVFNDTNSEEEGARRKAIEDQLIGNHPPAADQALATN
ncbi:hypothetical protein JMJ35_002639 [Cladonia borealis]|uniref:Major facilitator superfamily (MFS) profile domain-containing protein n=1 Tax=Cladonia borealis TaxID=184061 RepID=A0AA39R5L3_9LECA|nr:hypothetical protein JMJ35_002639 [Cladonia borealis]